VAAWRNLGRTGRPAAWFRQRAATRCAERCPAARLGAKREPLVQHRRFQHPHHRTTAVQLHHAVQPVERRPWTRLERVERPADEEHPLLRACGPTAPRRCAQLVQPNQLRGTRHHANLRVFRYDHPDGRFGADVATGCEGRVVSFEGGTACKWREPRSCPQLNCFRSSQRGIVRHNLYIDRLLGLVY
jgi:hypothetical protein